MGGGVIGINFMYGFPGTIARGGDEVSRARAVSADSLEILFGDPVVVKTDGTCSKFGASNTAADFAGIAMRRVKQCLGEQDANMGRYFSGDVCDILERGSIIVSCKSGTPQAGGTVYIRTKVTPLTSPEGAAVGDFEASTNSEESSHVTLTNAKWGGNKDANNACELVIISRQGV